MRWVEDRKDRAVLAQVARSIQGCLKKHRAEKQECQRENKGNDQKNELQGSNSTFSLHFSGDWPFGTIVLMSQKQNAKKPITKKITAPA